MDDSITLLKQTTTVVTEKSTDKNKKDNPSSKCCETCTLKPKPRKTYPMTRCSLCMVWYHDQCVGLDKDVPVGVWLCVMCRQVPQGLQDNLIDIKTDVEQLKEASNSIITILNTLSTEVTKNIQGINDKLTALSKQINCNDKKVTENLSSLNAASENMKTSFDQKTCQILNKTTTIVDKIKLQSDKINPTPAIPCAGVTQGKKPNENPNSENATANAGRSDKQTQSKKQPENSKSVDEQKESTSRSTQPKTQHSGDSDLRNQDNNETIDLTKSTPKKLINQSTLLVGSSILKGVKVNDQNKDTAVRSFSGVTIQKLQNNLNNYDINKCETIIMHVGGNDADDGLELANFRDAYSSLLDNVSRDNRHIIVSGLLPRDSVDLKPYNACLKTLCETKNVEFVDHYNGFLLASGDIADSYYHRDKLHPNAFGTRKLLRNLDAVHRVTNPNTQSQPVGPARRNGSFAGRAGFHPRGKSYHTGQYRNGPHTGPIQNGPSHNGPNQNQNGPKYCHICSIRGHRTQDCWYNGRNTGMRGYQAH